MGRGEALPCVFVKYFTKFLKVKYFTTFYKRFYDQWKLFYKFDHILHSNNYLKMRKHFLINSLLQNRRRVKFICFILSNNLPKQCRILLQIPCNETKACTYTFTGDNMVCCIQYTKVTCCTSWRNWVVWAHPSLQFANLEITRRL